MNTFNLIIKLIHIFRLEKMSGRFDRTNFVSGIETFFNLVTYVLNKNSGDKSFVNKVISEVCNLY